jgi:predicted RNase H-like HicB family nuclease
MHWASQAVQNEYGEKAMRPKTVDDYLALPYTVEVLHDQSGEQAGWFARVVELPGCMTQTDTFDELETMVQDAMRAWILTAPGRRASGARTRCSRAIHRTVDCAPAALVA